MSRSLLIVRLGCLLTEKKPRSNRNLAQQIVQRKLDEEKIEAAVDVLQETLTGAERTVWVACPHCKRKHEVTPIDALTRIKALEQLQNLGWGRPKPDEDERKQGFVLNRIIVEPAMSEVE